MVTVVNTPQSESNGSGTGWVVGVVLLILIILIVFLLGGPVLRRLGTDSRVDTPQIDVNVQGGGQNTTEDNNAPAVPDLNINQDTDTAPQTETMTPSPSSTPTSSPSMTGQ